MKLIAGSALLVTLLYNFCPCKHLLCNTLSQPLCVCVVFCFCFNTRSFVGVMWRNTWWLMAVLLNILWCSAFLTFLCGVTRASPTSTTRWAFLFQKHRLGDIVFNYNKIYADLCSYISPRASLCANLIFFISRECSTKTSFLYVLCIVFFQILHEAKNAAHFAKFGVDVPPWT